MRDQDFLLEVAGEGKLKAFVIARSDWTLSGKKKNAPKYLELPVETMLAARGTDHVIVDRGTGSDGEALIFKDQHEVFLGQVYFLADHLEKYRVVPQPGGLRAERNLEKTLAALALYVANADPRRFSRNRKPNADAIAEAVVAMLAKEGLADTGLSARAIQDRILTGLTQLKT